MGSRRDHVDRHPMLYRDEARPGLAPGSARSAGSMFAALYGELVPHAWRDPESGHDAYSLFYDRSIAMGWLDDRGAGGGVADRMRRAPGLWGMNDAGWEHPLAVPGLVSWFQVGVSAVPGDRPLPVQPFLRCAVDATTQAGALDLSAVQVLLPVQGLDPASRPPYAPVPAIGTVGWFAERNPESRTPVKVNINSGRDSSILAAVQQLSEHLADLDQDVFRCRSHDVAGQDAIPTPPFDDSFWNGPPLHGVVLRGELVEWSCDAIGWLAEVIADSAALLGVRTPLLLTITRT
ncbi:hypothetical protein ACWDV4_09785 [Micromonospora sp. NPDC003197]